MQPVAAESPRTNTATPAPPRSSVPTWPTAETTLTNAQAALVDLETQRAADEHAIAVLSGQAPADLTIAPDPNWTPKRAVASPIDAAGDASAASPRTSRPPRGNRRGGQCRNWGRGRGLFPTGSVTLSSGTGYANTVDSRS